MGTQTAPTTPTASPRESRVRRRSDGVIAIDWVGHVGAGEVKHIAAALRTLLTASPASMAVSNTTAMTGFDNAARALARLFFDELRAGGVAVIIVIAPQTLIRLAASTISLVCQVPLQLVANEQEAEAKVRHGLLRTPAVAAHPAR